MDMESILDAITEVICEWKQLGLKLKIPLDHLESIHLEQHTILNKKIAMIQRWLSGRPTWSALVEALVEVDMRNKAKEISQHHGKLY